MISLAVAQRPARVVRDDEDAGSNPAGETTDSSVAQRTTERAATNREVKGSIPFRGANQGAVSQKKESPLVERECAGSSPAGAAIHIFGA